MCNRITADNELEKSKLGAEGEEKRKSCAKWRGKEQGLIGTKPSKEILRHNKSKNKR